MRHVVVVAGCVALLAACSADATDFQRSAAQFIEGDTMTRQANTDFRGAECERPSGIDRGTTFTCTATSTGGAEWRFEVTIVDDSNFEITGREVVAG
ncbi:MAG: DUF4333 domain-containing protein [Ilumatobacteraceae bacterium]